MKITIKNKNWQSGKYRKRKRKTGWERKRKEGQSERGREKKDRLREEEKRRTEWKRKRKERQIERGREKKDRVREEERENILITYAIHINKEETFWGECLKETLHLNKIKRKSWM